MSEAAAEQIVRLNQPPQFPSPASLIPERSKFAKPAAMTQPRTSDSAENQRQAREPQEVPAVILQALDKKLEATPDDIELLKRRIATRMLLFHDESSMDASSKDISHLLELHPGDQEGLTFKQQLKFIRNHTVHEEASKLLAADPSNAEALMKRGRAAYELGQHADAVANLSRYLEIIAPKEASASVYSDLGSALLYLQRPVEASASPAAFDCPSPTARLHTLSMRFMLCRSGTIARCWWV